MVPNLDHDLDEKELREFWAKYASASREEAKKLIGDKRKGYTIFCTMLSSYAYHKMRSLQYRREGEGERAEESEKSCQNIYDKLPKDLRW